MRESCSSLHTRKNANVKNYRNVDCLLSYWLAYELYDGSTYTCTELESWGYDCSGCECESTHINYTQIILNTIYIFNIRIDSQY